MSSDIWIERHHLNVVYDALMELTKGGSTPVGDQMLLDYLKRQGLELSRRELAKILMSLEILGRVHVYSSGYKAEFQIKLLK